MNEIRFSHGKIRSHKTDGDALKIEGWANVESVDGVPSIDSYGTVFDADGFNLDRLNGGRLSMFFNHDWGRPVGRWDAGEVREEGGTKGLWLEGRVMGETDHQREVQTYVRQGTAPDLSIGFNQIGSEFIEEDGRSYEKIRAEIIETSIVTIGSNRDSVYSMARALAHGTDLLCPRCLDQSQIVSLPNIDAACRSLTAHTAEAIRRGDRHVLQLAASRIRETLDAVTTAGLDSTSYTDEEIAVAVWIVAQADNEGARLLPLDEPA